MRIQRFATILCMTATALLAAPSGFHKDCLERHNALRAKHGSAPLLWSDSVAKVAQDWANTIASEDRMRHRPNNKYGENIFWMSGAEPTGAQVANSWYSEIKDYSYNRPGFSMKTGHFTQVVWKNSKELGCGRAVARRGGIYVVCNYNPPGNYSGEFPKNVLPPK